MNKIFFYAAAGTLALASCSSDDSIEQNETSSQKVIITATAQADGTRATLGSDLTPLWETGDKLAVAFDEAEYSEGNDLSLTNGAGTGVGTFSGQVTVPDGAQTIRAYYPAPTVDLTTQDGTAKKMVMFATATYSATPSFNLENKTAILKLEMTAPTGVTTITSAYVEGVNSKGTLDAQGNWTSTSTDRINVSGLTVANGKITGYVVVLPGSNVNQLSIHLTANNTTYATEHYTSATATIAAGKLTTIKKALVPVWDGTTTKAITAVNDTYTVTEPAELAWLATQTNNSFEGKTINLQSDMYLEGNNWTPIANYARNADLANAFKGTFNGNNHTISGLKVSSTTTKVNVGLFGVVNGGTVKNVKIANADMTGTDGAAAVVGYMWGESTVENCTVESGTISSAKAAGGVVARAYGTNNVITDCVNRATVSGNLKAGGIVGTAHDGRTGNEAATSTTITNCKNYGDVDVNGVDADANCAAGILSFTSAETAGRFQKVNISGCDNYGAINTTGNRGNFDNQGIYAGVLGFVGNADVTISNCHNHGAVGHENGDYASVWAAGIVSYFFYAAPVNISGCTNEGAITGYSAGGIWGIVSSASKPGTVAEGKEYDFRTIANSSNSGVITGHNAGGIASSFTYGTLNTCANTGTLEGSVKQDPIVANAYKNVKITSCTNNGQSIADSQK